ncbi:MAG: YidB family protein [Xanthobacteraceae bacterium]
MGLFDELGGSLKGALGQVEASAAPALINSLLAKTQFGDLNGLVAQLQQGGLQQEVQSWLGNGANMPVTADQLKAALGNSQVQEIARHLGLPVDAALNTVAQHLPNAVDQASQNGKLQPAT